MGLELSKEHLLGAREQDLWRLAISLGVNPLGRPKKLLVHDIVRAIAADNASYKRKMKSKRREQAAAAWRVIDSRASSMEDA